MIAEQLAGQRVLITGSTGFVGTALVERLLRCCPDTELVLLVRPSRRRSVEVRVAKELLRNDAFDRLRSELGRDGFDAMCAERITVLAGDVGRDGLGLSDSDRAVFASCDTIIHSAATVSFDAPLDHAVEINLLGPTRLADLANELGVQPHLVAVSTCYVAGNHRGPAPEIEVKDSPWFIDLDWRSEVEAARRIRSDAEAESRTPARLDEFREAAADELGAAGGPLLANKSEQLRTRWVADQMVEAGRSRAAFLGWPDAYAYTKAYAEEALRQNRGQVPVSVVRPSIIESAWAEPSPGWIRGFRMAEPVIISYARGLLTEFPGVPEGIVDVIPVDIVVAAIMAVAARGPSDDDSIPIVQVASGSCNPLGYDDLVDLVQGWFSEHPLYDKHDQPISVAAWSFPGRTSVERRLRRATTLIDKAETVLEWLPLRGSRSEFAADLAERRDELERASTYVELYGAYTECQAVYGTERLLELHQSLDPSDQESLSCDPRIVDWARYVTEIHLPSVVTHARVRTSPGTGLGRNRSDRLRAQVLDPRRQLVAFDLENTIIASNVVYSYTWLASRHLSTAERLRLAAWILADAPDLLARDQADRTEFLRHFYRRYRGARVDTLTADAQELMSDHLLSVAFPAAVRRVRAHREAGHHTLLITGALEHVIAPLAPLFDDVIAARMTSKGGRYTGRLAEVPPTGETRSDVLISYAAEHDYDLSESVAYADSASDLGMLESVGFPVAVNPEVKLAAIARSRGWLVEQFEPAPGHARPLLPFAPSDRSTAG